MSLFVQVSSPNSKMRRNRKGRQKGEKLCNGFLLVVIVICLTADVGWRRG